MIIWGGQNIADLFNTGGRYNPGTDSWTATTTANAPDSREEHTAVWAGSEMIVWGGRNGSNGIFVNTGGRYCAQFTLHASGRRVQGRHTVDLLWNRATPANIDIYRDGVVIATVPNTGAYKDFIGVRGGNARYIYKVCDAGTQNCSNQVTVRFGAPPL